MKKNVASQVVGAQMPSLTNGDVTIYVTGDNGTQTIGSVGSGICTHKGNGWHTYAPSQGETNYDHIAFTFVQTDGYASTIQLFTEFPQTGDSFARIGAPVGASISADIAAVQSDTDNIQTRLPAALVGGRMDSSIGAVASGVIAAASFAANALDAVWSTTTRLLSAGTNIVLAKGTGVTGFNDLSAAQVNAEADTALSDVGLTTTVTGRIDAAITSRLASGSYTAPDNATIALIDAKTTNLPSDPADESLIIAATNSLAALIGTPAVTVSADIAAVKADTASILADTNELQTDWANGGRLDLILDARASQTSVDDLPTNAELATALGTADDAVLAAIGGLSIPTAGAVADAVWDEALSGHVGAGSAGEALSAAGTAGDPWTADLTGYSSGQAGYVVNGLPTACSTDLLATAVDGTVTLAESLRLWNSALGGKASGLGTSTAKFRDLADSKDRITATVDADGNRTAVTRDLT